MNNQRLEIEYSLKKGKIKGKLEFAEKLLATNSLSAEKIAELSGLPFSQIKAIEASVVHV